MSSQETTSDPSPTDSPASVSAAPTGRARRAAAVFIFVTILLDALGIGLIIPVGPRLVEELLPEKDPAFIAEAAMLQEDVKTRVEAAVAAPDANPNPSSETKPIAASDESTPVESKPKAISRESRAAPYVGLLGASYAAMQLIFGPLLGTLSDRFGRRPVILLSLAGSAIDFFAQALAPSLWFLFIARTLNGISGANITVANAYIADVTPIEKRPAAFGMIGAAFGLGFVIGPVAGGLLGDISIRLPFVVAGIVTLASVVYGVFVLPESLATEHRAKHPLTFSRLNPFGAIRNLRDFPGVRRIALVSLLLNLAQFGLHATWVLYTKFRYGWSTTQVGLSLFVVGIGAVVVQGGLARKIIPALGERRSLLLGVAIASLAYLCYGLAPQGWMIYIFVAIASIGAVSQPASQALITRQVGPREQGRVQGAFVSVIGLASVFGPILGGLVFAHFTAPGRNVMVPGAPFFVGSALSVVGFIVALTIPKIDGTTGRVKTTA
ncbi:MAG: TCR/Tet family MFS transporter [Phycisphaerales bacterium]